MTLRDPKCRYLPSRITGQAPRINLASFLALGHRAHSCMQWHLVTKEVKPAPEATPHLGVSTQRPCPVTTDLCRVVYFTKQIHQFLHHIYSEKDLPGPANCPGSAIWTHFFLPAHSVKAGVHIADAQLVWKVLKDCWHLPRKGLMWVHAQSCPTLCNPMDCSPPDSSVLGILQARILEWVAMTSSRGSSPPRDQTLGYDVSCIGRRILHHWTTWELWWIEHVIWYSY